MECGGECGMLSVECKVWSVEWRLSIVKCRVCGVYSVEWSVECGCKMWSVEESVECKV